MGITIRANRRGTGRRHAGWHADQGGADRRPFRRLHPGGAFDTPVDYDSLMKVGSIMGSGGMVVMDEDTNMVDVAKFYMEFCMEESCGKCIPCRAGTVQMYQSAERRSSTARPPSQDLEALEELCDMVKSTSLCGLGQTAPNPGDQHAALFPQRISRPAATRARRTNPTPMAIGIQPAPPTEPMAVKTLTIDGKPVSADETDTILQVATDAGITIPTLCHLEGLSDMGACRLCIVEVAGTQQTAARLRDESRRRDGDHDQQPRLQQIPADDPRVALRRAKPRLRGLRRQRPLRPANPRHETRHDACPFSISLPERHGRCLARLVRRSTTTAASSARAASGSATRSKAPHTWDVMGRGDQVAGHHRSE